MVTRAFGVAVGVVITALCPLTQPTTTAFDFRQLEANGLGWVSYYLILFSFAQSEPCQQYNKFWTANNRFQHTRTSDGMRATKAHLITHRQQVVCAKFSYSDHDFLLSISYLTSRHPVWYHQCTKWCKLSRFKASSRRWWSHGLDTTHKNEHLQMDHNHLPSCPVYGHPTSIFSFRIFNYILLWCRLLVLHLRLPPVIKRISSTDGSGTTTSALHNRHLFLYRGRGVGGGNTVDSTLRIGNMTVTY